MKKHLLPVFLAFILMTSTTLHAQVSQGGIPPGLYKYKAIKQTVIDLESPDTDSLILAEKNFQSKNEPYQVGVSLYTDIDPLKNGKWTTLENGSAIWQCIITSDGAKALALYFDYYQLPESAKLWAYTPDKQQILGAFTSENNNSGKHFAISYLESDTLILEYYIPDTKDLIANPFHINEVSYAYKNIFSYKDRFNTSGVCEVNINCSEGSNWRQQQKGVARILIKRNGVQVYCTGSLINNVREDRTPYFLTAGHCGKNASESDVQQWIFYFNYAASGCENPETEPGYNSVVGATTLANTYVNDYNIGSDLYLVRFTKDIPGNYPVYYNGWSISETPSNSGVGIHHPDGDIKKISTYTSPLEASYYKSRENSTHWEVVWAGTEHGHGVTEGGSSGSPIFNTEGLIVGTLTGGQAGCDSAWLTKPDYYGRFDYSWDKNGAQDTAQLKHWLDPDNTGISKLGGITLGMKEESMQNNLRIYPNPAHDFINIEIPSNILGNTAPTIEIRDITGRLIVQQQITPGSKTISLSLKHMQKGMIHLRLLANKQYWSAKAIVQ